MAPTTATHDGERWVGAGTWGYLPRMAVATRRAPSTSPSANRQATSGYSKPLLPAQPVPETGGGHWGWPMVAQSAQRTCLYPPGRPVDAPSPRPCEVLWAERRGHGCTHTFEGGGAAGSSWGIKTMSHHCLNAFPQQSLYVLALSSGTKKGSTQQQRVLPPPVCTIRPPHLPRLPLVASTCACGGCTLCVSTPWVTSAPGPVPPGHIPE